MKTSITHLAATTASVALLVGVAFGQDAEAAPLGPDDVAAAREAGAGLVIAIVE